MTCLFLCRIYIVPAPDSGTWLLSGGWMLDDDRLDALFDGLNFAG